MYDYFKGILTEIAAESYKGSYIVLEVNGIGYHVITGKRTVNLLKTGEETKVYVSLIHREDTMSLIGFKTKEERDIFDILQSVSGIGAKTAVVILDEFTVSELIDIMMREDAKELSRAKGVGAKVAGKIILELKDKLLKWSEITPVDVSSIEVKNVDSAAVAEAQSVMISLGYSVEECKNAIKEVLNYRKDCNKTEDILKYTLEYLSRIN